MTPFDDWNIIDEEEEEELQDATVSAAKSGLSPRKFTGFSPSFLKENVMLSSLLSIAQSLCMNFEKTLITKTSRRLMYSLPLKQPCRFRKRKLS